MSVGAGVFAGGLTFLAFPGLNIKAAPSLVLGGTVFLVSATGLGINKMRRNSLDHKIEGIMNKMNPKPKQPKNR